jgi:hypothetical protein
MDTHLFRQHIDINTSNNEVVNACVNNFFIQSNEVSQKRDGIEVNRFLHPEIYQYYAAYHALLNFFTDTVTPPELVEINDDIYMIEACSTTPYKEDLSSKQVLRIEFNCIRVEDSILHKLDSKKIFKRKADKIQLQAAYEQIHILLNEELQKLNSDIDYFNHL